MPRRVLLVGLVAVSACAVPATDAPAPPAAARTSPLRREAAHALDGRETFSLAGQGGVRFVSRQGPFAVRDDGALVELAPGGRTLAQDVLPELRASGDGRVVAFAVRTSDAVADVHVMTDGGAPARLTRDMPAVVVAISPRGDEVAFLAATNGLPALWVVGTDGGAARQLTNAGVTRDPARPGPPAGFVPPPRRAADVAWTDDAIEYASADGRVRIDVPTGAIEEAP